MAPPSRRLLLHQCHYHHYPYSACIGVVVLAWWLTVAQSITTVSTLASGTRASLPQAALSQTQAYHALPGRASPPQLRLRATTVVMEVKSGCRTLVVVGGGASGYFGAIQAASSTATGINDARSNDALQVVVLEAAKKPLSKVKISGGGRCNVMHDERKPVSVISQGYPRGSKQLIGPFKSLFGPADAAAWFKARGVTLKTEADGRMFPTTDNSQTIIDCLEGAANEAGVQVVTSAKVTSVLHRTTAITARVDEDDITGAQQRPSSRTTQPSFDLAFTTATPLSLAAREALRAIEEDDDGESDQLGGHRDAADTGSARRRKRTRFHYRAVCDYVLQATGSSREGHRWAERLGHAVSTPVPSLFTFTIKDPRLEGLSGLSVQDVELKLIAETPPSQSSGALSTDNSTSAVDGNDRASDSLGGDRGSPPPTGAVTVANSKNTKGRKKNKKGKKQSMLSQRGPLLITHTGVSGPAALKLSAFGARELSNGGYRAKLVVNWLAGNNPSKALDELQAFRTRNPKKTVYAFCPIGGDGLGSASAMSTMSVPPRRLWQSLALAAGVVDGEKWADMSKAKLSALARELTACELQVVGKGTFKDEFVTCGGVALSAVDMHTMESRNVPGLFFAGEVVDIDGITGGFNFQSAWTTGWVAGTAVGSKAVADGVAAAEILDARLHDDGAEVRRHKAGNNNGDTRGRWRKVDESDAASSAASPAVGEADVVLEGELCGAVMGDAAG